MKGGCDCHVHVFGPPDQYAFSRDRKYTPLTASAEELQAHLRSLDLERVVIVQPSVYGTDNACTLDALSRLGARARGVAVIDKSISDENLKTMHKAGIRGVRANLQTSGVHDPAAARREIEQAAARVAPLGWHVQVFTNIGVIAALKEAILELQTPLVVDHFGLPQHGDGFDVLVSLVRAGRVYVKLSGAHRFFRDPDADAPAYARALIEADPGRVVWGSDWPHPPSAGAARSEPLRPAPFERVDDARAIERLRSWAPDEGLFRKILVENPARLYDF